ncbi:glycosyl transferase [Synechococcus sp. CCY9202]|uniref:glycosyl transferase n=1 Tax=Synechococcus sp. CCY9202 TaxID=174698 RepID=UPI002B20D56F|nr:glycosyl transferase [Synechococcus sp. CCY9202]MEA5423882.1 glycosyl transferase [Synechococcus sp. CCY9202]
MSDFFQNGIVTTLHDLGGRSEACLAAAVAEQAQRLPLTLVLPCLHAELRGPALEPFVRQLATIPWLNEIVIGLDRADAAGFREALALFSQLPQPHHLIWNDGPRVTALIKDLGHQQLAPAERGKGHNIWLCLGLVQALGRAEVVALHDCDVVSFTPRMLARLVYPLLHPDSGFVFAKAYYPRISAGVMYGRVSRLFVTPLLRALRRCLPPSRYLEFLDSFRYPLAGECAMRWSAARRLHLPSDWGMEIGVLTEIFRDHSTRQLCQVDIAEAYDHKHQPFPPETDHKADHETDHGGGGSGLGRMGRDIALGLFRGLAAQGQVLDLALVRSLATAYQRIVLDLLDSHAADAALNGLRLDRGEETRAVSFFAACLLEAGRSFVQEDQLSRLTPTWDEVSQRRPEVLSRLAAAVAADRADHAGA